MCNMDGKSNGDSHNDQKNILETALSWHRAELRRRWTNFIDEKFPDRRTDTDVSVDRQSSATGVSIAALAGETQALAPEASDCLSNSKRRFPADPVLRERAEQQQREREERRRANSTGCSISGCTGEFGPDGKTLIGIEPSSICAVEVTKGRQRVYSSDKDGQSFQICDEKIQRHTRFRDLISSYVLPNGYPDSVAPEYSEYMFWRGVQYFFGGAISVFTTRSLLGALGVNSRGANEAAAAINWVLKDGAGRLGRFLFARWGRQLDCELKQFRLMGDLLMEAGAALELSTIAFPSAFLPLACTANLAKNLAGVTASATRAPIYRTFAKENNMADITAKGESVANLADILGTIFGILLFRTRWPVVPCFAGLSAGYLYASRREVDSVVLPYLNRARLAYAARRYLELGYMPEPVEANRKEPLLPWREQCGQGELRLGARVEEACTGPLQLATALKVFEGLPYAITYRPDKRQVMVLLREDAGPADALQAAFHGHFILYSTQEARAAGDVQMIAEMIAGSVRVAPATYKAFIEEASMRGWRVGSSILDVMDHRLRILDPQPVQ
mmetsp:Transcript_2721/g.6356  ORF Transcript_2721/g.6356 Transcript_2721/m.6356 type:complete len:561 (-) Transcript_2721:65-1747(-)